MSFEARKEAALKELKEAGIWEINSKPPALLFLWWLGVVFVALIKGIEP